MDTSTTPVVHVVHCVDTEGPLHESVDATFERINELFGMSLEPSSDLLAKLQGKEVDLGGIEDEVARVFSPSLLTYNDTWDKIDDMMARVMSDAFRLQQPDSFGRGWVFNWHCVDHVGFEENPRRRDLGYHNVFDYYRFKTREEGAVRDEINFHYHPVPINKRANACATAFFANSHSLFQILARRIVDRHWFPCAFRPGFHAERPDSHWFLEQYIPFDYANQVMEQAGESAQSDLMYGRFGDWHRAPKSWRPYHPSHDDYQTSGQCRRWIFRCLNVGTRLRLLTQDDIDRAFGEAQQSGESVVLAFANHDYRDVAPDVDRVRDMLADAAKRFADIPFRYSGAKEAAQNVLGLSTSEADLFALDYRDGRLFVEAQRPIFGPQPFLAIRTKNGTYHHDNLDVEEPFRLWAYALDDQTVEPDAVDRIGVGACDASGNAAVSVMTLNTKETVSVIC